MILCLLSTDMSTINNSNCRTTLKSQKLNLFNPLPTANGKVQNEAWMDTEVAYELFHFLR